MYATSRCQPLCRSWRNQTEMATHTTPGRTLFLHVTIQNNDRLADVLLTAQKTSMNRFIAEAKQAHVSRNDRILHYCSQHSISRTQDVNQKSRNMERLTLSTTNPKTHLNRSISFLCGDLLQESPCFNMFNTFICHKNRTQESNKQTCIQTDRQTEVQYTLYV